MNIAFTEIFVEIWNNSTSVMHLQSLRLKIGLKTQVRVHYVNSYY